MQIRQSGGLLIGLCLSACTGSTTQQPQPAAPTIKTPLADAATPDQPESTDAAPVDTHDPVADVDAGVTQPAVHDMPKDAAPARACSSAEVVVSQAKLDELFSGCTQIAGSLYIDANGVTDLHALSHVEGIDGSLAIGPELTKPLGALAADASRVQLTQLAGLEQLREIHGDLVLRQLPVTELTPLSALRTLGALSLEQLPLTSLHGLEHSAYSGLRVAGNAGLKSLEGLGQGVLYPKVTLTQLDALETLQGLRSSGLAELTIDACPALSDLSGAMGTTGSLRLTNLAGLRSTAGWTSELSQIYIDDAPLLSDLEIAGKLTSAHSVTLHNLPALTALTAPPEGHYPYFLGIEACDGLEDLRGLEHVSRLDNLQISHCHGLRSLTGLDALQQSSEVLAFVDLPQLTSLSGLGQLQKASFLNLRDLPALTSLAGLDQLAQLSHLGISGNTGLTNLHGLPQLDALGILSIEDDPVMASLDGLTATSVSLLQLINDTQLSSITALSPVTSLYDLKITGNPLLSGLNGLEHIPSARNFTLANNAHLSSLRGLAGLTHVDTPTIEQNPQLPQCEITWLAARAQFEPHNLSSNGPVGSCEP